MCNLSEVVFEKGYQKGFKIGFQEGFLEGFMENYHEGLIESRIFCLKNLMDSTGMDLEQAMAVLEVPEEDRAQCRELLTGQAVNSRKGGSIV